MHCCIPHALKKCMVQKQDMQGGRSALRERSRKRKYISICSTFSQDKTLNHYIPKDYHFIKVYFQDKILHRNIKFKFPFFFFFYLIHQQLTFLRVSRTPHSKLSWKHRNSQCLGKNIYQDPCTGLKVHTKMHEKNMICNEINNNILKNRKFRWKRMH